MNPIAEELDRLRPSERLRLFATWGVEILQYGDVGGDFVEFATRHEYAQRMEKTCLFDIAKLFGDDQAREELHQLHLFGHWASTGLNVFDLTPDLVAALMLTRPLEPSSALQLPFPVFFIKVPEGTIPLFARDRQYWADGLWIHRFRGLHRKSEAPAEFFRWTATRGALRVWKDRLSANIDDPHDEQIFHQAFVDDPPYVAEDEITRERSLLLIKNLLSWLEATGGLAARRPPEPPPLKRKASRQARAQRERSVWLRVWKLGEDVKVKPELKQLAREFVLGQSERHAVSGWQLRRGHWVEGHWKQQPYGPERSLRKLIYIEPYYRGPDENAAWMEHLRRTRSEG